MTTATARTSVESSRLRLRKRQRRSPEGCTVERTEREFQVAVSVGCSALQIGPRGDLLMRLPKANWRPTEPIISRMFPASMARRGTCLRSKMGPTDTYTTAVELSGQPVIRKQVFGPEGQGPEMSTLPAPYLRLVPRMRKSRLTNRKGLGTVHFVKRAVVAEGGLIVLHAKFVGGRDSGSVTPQSEDFRGAGLSGQGLWDSLALGLALRQTCEHPQVVS